jgi:argininosuccinate synthase
MKDQKDLDMQFAQAIMGDGKFENDLDYMDDNAGKLGRKKMRTDAMKRGFAINGIFPMFLSGGSQVNNIYYRLQTNTEGACNMQLLLW